jgi:long-chain fatty acid transport protein
MKDDQNKKMRRSGCLYSFWLTVFAMFFAASIPEASFAGGLFLTEIGTNDVGLAGAGWAARAQDPATLFRNPAGMSLLEGNQALIGAQLLYGRVGFTPSAGTTVSGGSGGNPIDVFPGLSAFYTHSFGKDFKAGFGLFSHFGLAEKFNGDWVGRYYVKESFLAGISFMPAASYRINEWFSVGGGLDVMLAQLKYVTSINQSALGPGDGQLKLQDVTAGVGGNVGVMVEPKKGTRFGATYYSPISLDFGSTPSYQNLGPGTSAALNAAGLIGNRIDLGLTVPQHVIVSVYQEMTDRLAVMGDFGWENWSRFGKVDVSVSDTQTSLTTNIPYQDTYHVGGGVRYRLNPAWLINTGYAYDTSMVKDADRTLSLPVGATNKFGLGAEWQASEKYSVGFNYELAWVGDLPVHQKAALPASPISRGTVNGTYKNTSLNFFAVNLKW